jgi:hypothetical protein
VQLEQDVLHPGQVTVTAGTPGGVVQDLLHPGRQELDVGGGLVVPFGQ